MKPSDMETYKVKMKEVREFVTTYNSHFLTNFKAEELLEKKSNFYFIEVAFFLNY